MFRFLTGKLSCKWCNSLIIEIRLPTSVIEKASFQQTAFIHDCCYSVIRLNDANVSEENEGNVTAKGGGAGQKTGGRLIVGKKRKRR